MSAPGLSELRKRAVPGRCLCCPNRIGPRRVICRRVACTELYLRAWHRDAKRAHPERYGSAFYRANRAVVGAVERVLASRPAPRASRMVVAGGTRGGGYFSVRVVPMLANNGESYSAFCRRVARGWTRAEAGR